MRPEEQYANELYSALEGRFRKGIETILNRDGPRCLATRGERSCAVSCFNTLGREYLLSFKRDSQTLAWGRTSSQSELVDALVDWLDGAELFILYEKFEFVDQLKRALIAFRDAVFKNLPEMTQAVVSELRHRMCDGYSLWFSAKDRSCEVYFYGKNPSPDAYFHWDECEIFSFRADDLERFACVLQRWLYDLEMPSTLKKEFPWLEIGKLAGYYEEGRPIEGEFLQSWDWIEKFYRDYPNIYPKVQQGALSLIAQLRQAGYDSKLRAGQSLWTLIVSRSRRHGLRMEQPDVAFVFNAGSMDVYVKPRGKLFVTEKTFSSRIELTPEVEVALRQLTEKPID